MMLFDTHAHYDDERFDSDRLKLLEAMPSDGIGYIANIGTDLETSRMTLKLTELFPFIYGAVGFHPHQAKDMTNEALDEIVSMLSSPKIRALGEIGLDYHYDFSERPVQREVFARQLEIAKGLDIPVIIHEREACKDVLDILRASGVRRGVVHCFGGSRETAKELLDMGFYISFTGVITFQNARKGPEVVSYIPSDRIMAETDCPYLTPAPFRKERNHSGYLKYTVNRIAELRSISFEEAAEITFTNGCKFYGIEK
ncbi:MAG: TatD family hydrolase [Clostridiaceae bacterium]|nr:TatD family hydrolase [Clostridiaceae bacterium]